MKIQIHPQAQTNFDEKACALLDQLIPDPNLPRKRSIINSEMVVHKVEPVEVTAQDYVTELGGEIAKTFKAGNQRIGLFDEGYRNLVRLAEEFQKRRGISEFVSLKAVIDGIFAWIEQRYRKETGLTMCDFVVFQFEQNMKEVELWLPIHRTTVEREFSVGKCVIKTISKKMIDDWHQILMPHVLNDKEVAMVHMAAERAKFQGFAAATIRILAEPIRASEVAVIEAEKALGILRLFTAASFHPNISSYCVLLGKEHLEGIHTFTVDDKQIRSSSEWSVDTKTPFTHFSWADIQEDFQSGLADLSALIAKENPTSFEDEFLQAVFQYSRACLTKDISDKLVHILVGIESLLLKDGGESIQKNVGERMAALIGTKYPERKAVIDAVTRTYSRRSSFIHHGQRVSIDDTTLIKHFMLCVWETIHSVLRIIIENPGITRHEFFSLIEEKQLSY